MHTITVGAYEAKTNLGHLLGKVAKGGEVIITKHEKPVARLSGVSPRPQLSRDEVLARIAGLATRAKPGPDSPKDLINAGRKL